MEQRNKILVVDDNELSREIAVEALLQMGARVKAVGSGQAAIELLEKGGIDLVLMDYRMPDMDGIATTETIRAYEREHQLLRVPILAMTGEDDVEAVNAFYEAGMDEVMTKPLTPRILFERLEEYNIEGLSLPFDDASAPALGRFENVHICNFDIATGLRYAGSDKLYQKYLSDFYRLIDTKLDKLKSLWERRDIKDFTIEVHALKSSARTLGNRQLFLLCQELEGMGDANDVEAMKAKVPDMFLMYEDCKRSLKPLVESTMKTGPAIDKPELVQQLRFLYGAADTFDLDTADEVMAFLQKSKGLEDYEDQLNELADALADVDIQSVLLKTNELLDSLG